MTDNRVQEDSRASIPEAGARSDDGKVPALYNEGADSKTPPSKAEIQERLQRTSDSISERVRAIQEELNLTGKTVRTFLGSPLVRTLAALGAGIVVGRMFGGSHGKGFHASDPDALTDLLSREVELALDRGEPLEEAIQRVVDSVRIGDARPPKASESVMKWIAELALRSVLSHGIDTMVSREPGSKDDGPEETLPAEGRE